MKLKTEYIILVIIIGLTCFIISQKSNIEEKITNTKRERTIHIEIGKNNRKKIMKERNRNRKKET